MIQDITSVSDVTYTLILGDGGNLVALDNAGSITLEVPANATVAFPIGTRIDFYQKGAGAVTVTGAAGVTINAAGGTVLSAATNQRGLLQKTATNSWLLSWFKNT